MIINVKFPSEQQIESDAQGLLEAYFHEVRKSIQLPVPADEIMETHLYSSCLLMPRQCVLDAWIGRFGSLKPIVYADIAEQNWTRRPVRRGMKPIGLVVCNVFEQNLEPHAYTFESVAREFAPMFRVSIQAMRIRLENLGLLRIDHPAEQDLFANQ